MMDEYNNLSEEDKKNYDISNLGDGVELVGYSGDDGKVDLSQAITKSSFKFDGVDDYIKINLEEKNYINEIVENGFTFEFYGTMEEDGRDWNQNPGRGVSIPECIGLFGLWTGNLEDQAMLRFNISPSEGKYQAIWSPLYGDILKWWDPDYVTDKNKFYSSGIVDLEDGYWNQYLDLGVEDFSKSFYLTIVVDPTEQFTESFPEHGVTDNLSITQEIYVDGVSQDKKGLNKLLWDFLINKDLKYDFNCFCVGLCSLGGGPEWHLLKGDCYSLRLYNRALTEGEVTENYKKTKEYHELLENQ